MADVTRNSSVFRVIDEINKEAESYWRAIEVTVPESFKDPWERDFGQYRPEDDDLDGICDPQVNPSFEEDDL
eukprot:10529706-Karenia_brevis.AAC.1